MFNNIDEWRTGIGTHGASLSAFNGRPMRASSTGVTSWPQKGEY
jgi:hypothetical protein